MAQRLDINGDRQAALDAACKVLADGLPIGLPTETVYGLAADATNPTAISRIYETKGRPRFNPLIIHCADMAMASILEPVAACWHERLVKHRRR